MTRTRTDRTDFHKGPIAELRGYLEAWGKLRTTPEEEGDHIGMVLEVLRTDHPKPMSRQKVYKVLCGNQRHRGLVDTAARVALYKAFSLGWVDEYQDPRKGTWLYNLKEEGVEALGRYRTRKLSDGPNDQQHPRVCY